MSSDIPEAGLPVIRAGGMHLADNLLTAPAIGAASGGHRHPPAVVEGRAGNKATVRASAGCPACRGLDPSVRRLFVLDGARAPSPAVRRTFGAGIRHPALPGPQGQEHPERLPGRLHAGCCLALRQAREPDDAGKAGRRLRNLARRLELDAPCVSGSIPEGLDEILMAARPGLPKEFRRALATTDMIGSAHSVVRQTCPGAVRWRSAGMALRDVLRYAGGREGNAPPRGLSAAADPEGRTGASSPGRCGNHRHRPPRTGGMMINRQR